MTKAFKMPDGTVVRVDDSSAPETLPEGWTEVGVPTEGEAAPEMVMTTEETPKKSTKSTK